MSLINIIKFFNRPNGKPQLFFFFFFFYVFPICTCTGRLTTNHLAYEYKLFRKKCLYTIKITSFVGKQRRLRIIMEP